MRTPIARKERRGSRGDDGFTLVELLVVLAIIGMVAGLVGPQVLRYLGSARASTTETQLKSLGSALELYYLDLGSYPTKDQGLGALVSAPPSAAGWNGPYLKTQGALKDGWGRDYLYEADGRSARIASLGRDGNPQGEGLDADLEYRAQ